MYVLRLQAMVSYSLQKSSRHAQSRVRLLFARVRQQGMKVDHVCEEYRKHMISDCIIGSGVTAWNCPVWRHALFLHCYSAQCVPWRSLLDISGICRTFMQALC